MDALESKENENINKFDTTSKASPNEDEYNDFADLFVSKGFTDDEITLLFDDGNKLYVSKSFLMYASPVFEAMMKTECKEMITGVVELNEKEYDDFLELLNCLQPRLKHDVDEDTVYRVLPLAHEYQIDRCIEECDVVLTTIVNNDQSLERGDCLKAFLYATKFELESTKKQAIKSMKNRKFRTYYNTQAYKDLTRKTQRDLMYSRLVHFD